MCTIVVALAVWPDSPLVIAANRDEMLARASEPARLRAAGEIGERAVLAPRDQVGGGTWLGLGDLELVVGITNRRSGPAKRELRSRGELVSGALGRGDRERARAWVEQLDPRDYNPFHLLLADRLGAEVVWSDGGRFTRVGLEPGVHWLTERSFGAGASWRHDRLAELARTLVGEDEPELADWQAILADHRPYTGLDQVGFDSMCVHARAVGYGTRSSTVVRLGQTPEQIEFHHAPGRPCETAFVDHSAEARQLLANPSGD